MTTNRLATPLSQPTDIPTAIPIGQPTRTDSAPRSDQASHGRTDGRTDEELPHPGSESSRNASPAGGLEEFTIPGQLDDLEEPRRDRLYEFDTSEGPRLGWYRPYIWVEAFHSNRAWPVDDVASWRLLVPQPLNSEPVLGPVEGRGVAEIRADLARLPFEYQPPTMPQASHRLLGDVPSLLAEVEAAHRFEQSVAVEVAELIESLERVTEARDAFKDERNSALAEVRSLRGVVRQIREVRGCLGAGPMDYEAFVDEVDRSLAAAADAPKPEPCGVEWVGCYAADLHYSCAEPKGHVGNHRAGPSPAVLPEKEPKEQRDV